MHAFIFSVWNAMNLLSTYLFVLNKNAYCMPPPLHPSPFETLLHSSSVQSNPIQYNNTLLIFKKEIQ